MTQRIESAGGWLRRFSAGLAHDAPAHVQPDRGGSDAIAKTARNRLRKFKLDVIPGRRRPAAEAGHQAQARQVSNGHSDTMRAHEWTSGVTAGRAPAPHSAGCRVIMAATSAWIYVVLLPAALWTAHYFSAGCFVTSATGLAYLALRGEGRS